MAIILLSGKSGSNREEVAQLLCQDYGFKRVTTLTTREPLGHEQVGEAYCFTNKAHFETLINYGMMMEHTEHNGNLYGVTKAKLLNTMELTHNVVVTLTPDGVAKLRKYLHANGIAHVAVYLDCEIESCVKTLNAKRVGGELSEREYINRVCSLATTESKWGEHANRSSTFDIIIESDPTYEYDASDSVGLITAHSNVLNNSKVQKLG